MNSLVKATWVELKLFAREPLTMMFTFAIPLVILYVLGGVFGNHPEAGTWRGFGAMNFYVPAYVGLVMTAMGVIALPVHLASYREQGVLRRFRASSIPILAVFGAQVVVTVVLSALASLLLVLLANLTYDIKSPQSLVGVFGAFLLGALMFATLGVFLGLALPTARAAQGLGLLLWFVMMMVAGSGPPYEVLPATLVRVGDATPLKHLVHLLQDPWMGLGWNGVETLVVTAFLTASALLAVYFARRI